MTLLIGINFNTELLRLYNTNCVAAADKYLVTGRNCAQAKVALAIERLGFFNLLVSTVGLQKMRSLSPVFIILMGKKVVISNVCLTLEVIFHPK